MARIVIAYDVTIVYRGAYWDIAGTVNPIWRVCDVKGEFLLSYLNFRKDTAQQNADKIKTETLKNNVT